MSSFDVRKEIRERRLREAAEQKRDEPQPSAPPEAQIIRPLRPPSARSSGQDFGDAESYQIHSEPDEEWYQDETQEGKHEQVPFLVKDVCAVAGRFFTEGYKNIWNPTFSLRGLR